MKMAKIRKKKEKIKKKPHENPALAIELIEGIHNLVIEFSVFGDFIILWGDFWEMEGKIT